MPGAAPDRGEAELLIDSDRGRIVDVDIQHGPGLARRDHPAEYKEASAGVRRPSVPGSSGLQSLTLGQGGAGAAAGVWRAVPVSEARGARRRSG